MLLLLFVGQLALMGWRLLEVGLFGDLVSLLHNFLKSFGLLILDLFLLNILLKADFNHSRVFLRKQMHFVKL